jgi:hypothetical protein
MKKYIGVIDERNGDMDYSTQYLFTTKGNPDKYTDKVAMNWRGGTKSDLDKDHEGYWYDNTLIYTAGYREIPEEDYIVLSKYLAVL